MPEPADPDRAKTGILDVKDAEIVDGPEVIAGKVVDAMRDADWFKMPSVKPPLTEALDEVQNARTPAASMAGEPAEQDALSGKSAAVDEKAGSTEVLQPAERAADG